MNGEPDAAEIIKAAKNRTRPPRVKTTPGLHGEPVPVPLTEPEAAAEVVSGEPEAKPVSEAPLQRPIQPVSLKGKAAVVVADNDPRIKSLMKMGMNEDEAKRLVSEVSW